MQSLTGTVGPDRHAQGCRPSWWPAMVIPEGQRKYTDPDTDAVGPICVSKR